MSIKCFFLVFFTIIVNNSSICEGVSVEEDLAMTQAQKLVLDRFRSIVDKDLTQEYMHMDIYLVKWLRAKDFDIDAATEMLRKALKWRKDNKIDGILTEQFPFAAREFPYYMDAVDKTGRPVACIDIGDMDSRKSYVSGKMEEAYRYSVQAREKAMSLIRKAQSDGFNVTQSSLIVDLEGFNLIKSVCVTCLPYYVRFLLDNENYYPGVIHKLYFVNSPASIDSLMQILLPLTSPDTRKSISFYGRNRKEWKPVILREISPDQLRRQFGGTVRDDNELDVDF